MSAEGFALYWAQDAEEQRWATIKGAHVPLDKEGEPTGKVGEKIKRDEARKKHEPRPLESTAPDMARYRELVKAQGGNAKKGAHEYFKEFLQDTHMEARTNEGPIQVHFTGGTWKELRKAFPGDVLKAELLPYLADIIATGEYAAEPPSNFHPKVKQFHTYRKTIQTSVGPIKVIVDVADRPSATPRYGVYNLTREGTRNYEDRREKEKTTADSSLVSYGPNHIMQGKIGCVEDSISPQFEVVNLRIEDVTVDEDTIVANVTREFREWLRAEREARLARDAAPEGCGRVRPGCFTGPFAGLNRISVDKEGRTWA